MTDREKSRSFGQAASAYESGRPGYPAEAVAWMLEYVREPGRALRVADVGAGTGKLTRTVVELGADVVAIDPDADMLAALRAHVHGVPTFVGTAEQLPLPDAALDAVVMGQAWHWVDPEGGSREIGRVLRSGGALGLVWNIRDESVEWVRRLSDAMGGSNAENLLAGDGPRVAPPFDGLEHRAWRWERRIDLHQLRDLVSHAATSSRPTPRNAPASMRRWTESWHPSRIWPMAVPSPCPTSPMRSAAAGPSPSGGAGGTG